jgi:hypothetical protein
VLKGYVCVCVCVVRLLTCVETYNDNISNLMVQQCRLSSIILWVKSRVCDSVGLR